MTYLGITCRYPTTCNESATTIIIHGCYEQHISEVAVCNFHYIVWKDLFADTRIFCRCGLPIKDFDLTHIQNIISKYRDEYILNTTHPHTRIPYTHPDTRSGNRP
jgi:hypothetical protein